MINREDISKNFQNEIKAIDGGICAVSNVKVAGVRDGKYGIALILSPNSVVAGVFTSNKVIAAPVDYTKRIVAGGKISAIVANSGNANSFNADQGVWDCENTVDTVSKLFNINRNEIAVASTGVIGRKMRMDIIKNLINKCSQRIENSNEASINAAKAIMTTDTVYKESAVEVVLENGEIIRIGGICKGSGMIAPNMGTMLCFIATDIISDQKTLKKVLKRSVDDSFNMVVVDGDESTNDTVLLFANGESKNGIITTNEIKNNISADCSNNYNVSNSLDVSEIDYSIEEFIDKNFQEGLNLLCKDLAKQIAKDGEGATKFLEVEVNGARTKYDAQIAAKSVIKSSLLKSAVFGGNPNWGRIIVAIGYSKASMDPNKITIALSSENDIVYLVLDGKILAFEGTENLKSAEELMQYEEIKIIIDLNEGKSNATAYGCDLTYDYVKINAEYTT